MTDLAVGDARRMTIDLLVAAGVGRIESEDTAEALLLAEAWNIPSHGLRRLPWYLRRLSAGGINPNARLEEVRSRGATLAYDGGGGLGHWQAWQAAHDATDRAREHGIGMVSVSNSNHCGSLGVYALPMLRAGYIGVVFSNGPGVMPPWGGTDALLSTSPIAAGIPCGPEHAIIDLALSAVARGKIFTRLVDGEPLPEGWAVDKHGVPTVDPEVALAGMLAPLGGAKGYALAFLVEGLTGGMVGPKLSADVVDMFDADRLDVPQGIGHLLVAIDPAGFDGDGLGRERLDDLRGRVGSSGGRLPGGRREADLDQQGRVTIPQEALQDLRDWTEARDVEVALPETEKDR